MGGGGGDRKVSGWGGGNRKVSEWGMGGGGGQESK